MQLRPPFQRWGATTYINAIEHKGKHEAWPKVRSTPEAARARFENISMLAVARQIK
jgi:hypothetical protein